MELNFLMSLWLELSERLLEWVFLGADTNAGSSCNSEGGCIELHPGMDPYG